MRVIPGRNFKNADLLHGVTDVGLRSGRHPRRFANFRHIRRDVTGHDALDGYPVSFILGREVLGEFRDERLRRSVNGQQRARDLGGGR